MKINKIKNLKNIYDTPKIQEKTKTVSCRTLVSNSFIEKKCSKQDLY